MEKISIIIRNKNEAEYIGFAIQSCLDFFEKPQIIIMDNHSVDDSLEIVNLFSDRTEIIIETIKDYTPGRAINRALNQCTNDLILVLSAHCQITKINIDYVKDSLKKYKAVFGKQIPIYRGKKISARYIWSHFTDNEQINMFSDIEKRYFFHNAFAFYQKKFLLDNPMPEEIPGKEDRFWAKAIVDLGYDYLYNPLMQVKHFYTSNGATWKGIG